ncbi:MAG: lipopolysaccharide heptosyltransferase II [Gammaproteobacteria bacterium]|jgi:heptosyltransferase-2
MQKTTNKILIIGPSWVGDTIMAQCLFKLLKQIDPATQIDVLSPKFLHPLLQRMPEVNQTIDLNLKHKELGLIKRYKLAKSLTKKNYSQAIVLPNSLKSALIPFFARIPLRTGWRGEWRYGLLNDLRILNKQHYPLMIERFMALGLPYEATLPEAYPLPKLNINKELVNATLKKFINSLDPAVKPRDKVLALCPGAEYGSAKRWPAENFAHVAEKKRNENWQVWLFGGKKDEVIGQEIQNKTKARCVNLIGKTDLGEVTDLLSLTDFVITNDSGLMHVAAALDLQTIAIYGSTSPKFTPPLSNKVEILQSELSCAPCFKRACKFGHYKCLREITPEQVLKLL